MFSVLPFVEDADGPGAIVAAYRDATAPGSYLTVSHGTADYRPEQAEEAAGIYSRASHPVTLRGRERIRELMAGYALIPPGLVDVINWRPDPRSVGTDPLGGDVARYSLYGAVGRRA
jgi:hypothetical protein